MTGIYPDIPAVFYVCNRKMDRQLLWFSDIVQCITETAKWKYPVLSDSLCFQFSALKGFTVAVGDPPIDFCVLASRDNEPNALRFALVEDLFVDERRMLSVAHH